MAANYSIDMFTVRHRVTGTGSTYNRMVFDLKDENSQYVTTNVVYDAIVTDPNGAQMNLAALTFYSYGLLKKATYDAATGFWGTWVGFDYAEFRSNTTDALMSGVYQLKVTTIDGQVLSKEFTNTESFEFSVIDSGSFSYSQDAAEGMLWEWTLPSAVFSLNEASVTRAIVQVMQSGTPLMLYSVEIPTHMGKVYLPKTIMDELSASGGDQFSFSIQIRKPDGSDRASSSVVKFQEFPPPDTTDTGTAYLNSDLSLYIPKISHIANDGTAMELEAGFLFLGEQNGKLTWALETYLVK